MNYIRSWVIELIIIFFVSSVLELFLTEGEMKKYLRVLLGFFIIVLIISPLNNILNFNFNEYENILNNSQEILLDKDEWNEEIDKMGENVHSSNVIMLKKYYSSEIEEKISKELKYNYPDLKNEVEVILDKNLKIAKVNIQFNENKNLTQSEITPIEINFEKDNSSDKKEMPKIYSIDVIKKEISNILDADEDKIKVNFRR